MEKDFKKIMRERGEKVTKARVAILTALSRERYPISIKDLKKKVSSPNESTLYRSLENLVLAKVVRRLHLDGKSTLYEISLGRPHHHHIKCLSCGKIEDVGICDQRLEEKALKISKYFSSIKDHAFEFFGTCNKCHSHR